MRSRVVAKSQTAFAMNALQSARPVLGRTTVAHPPVVGQVLLRCAEFAHGDKLPMLLVQFADFVFQ